MNDSDPKVNQSLYHLEAYLTPLVCVCTFSEYVTEYITLLFMKMKLSWLTNEKTLLLQHLEYYWLEMKGTFP